MLNNFHLAVIVRERARTRLLRIPLHRRLQDTLADSWQNQFDRFTAEVKEIDFNAGYQPEAHEHFRLPDFELPDWLANEDSQTVPDLDAISHDDTVMDAIKGIAGFARNERGEELILFQNFSRSHVIRPGRFLFLKNDTYETTERAGLALDTKLAAVYFRAEGKLLFHCFRTVNAFLPLVDFYKEATDPEIHEVLGHERLAPEDVNASIANANQWFRKRIAMLRASRVLDLYSVQEIKQRSRAYDLDIRVLKDKIVFPADKAEAKKLLQFLNEEIFRGAITETLYETNSKREAD